jgi:hypothetical protein
VLTGTKVQLVDNVFHLYEVCFFILIFRCVMIFVLILLLIFTVNSMTTLLSLYNYPCEHVDSTLDGETYLCYHLT